MNQILMVENRNKKSKRNSGPIEINNIIRFFAITITIFAIFIISHSSYAIYRDSKGNNTDNLAQISISRINDTLIVDVNSEYIIDKFKYNWLNSTQTSVMEGMTNFQEEIILPNGNDVLTIILEDETGRAVTYTKEIFLEGVDILKPTIDISQGQGASIRITATDETQIEYITYRIDDREEIRVNKNNEDDKRIEYAITDLPRGEHTLYVTAVDSSGNFETDEHPIIVSSDRPTITGLSIDHDNGRIIIEAADVDGIASIEVNLNGAVYRMNDVNRTEATFSLNLQEGTNTISIKITNVNGLSVEGATEFDYAR